MNAIRRLAIYAVQAAGTVQQKVTVSGGNDGTRPPPTADSRHRDEPVAQSESRSATRG
jgi:hypothetical protein